MNQPQSSESSLGSASLRAARPLAFSVAGLVCLALASGCVSSNGSPSEPQRRPAPRAQASPTVAEQVGQGPVTVHGASVYSPGQKIYRELRREDSLMAFLACQGEPDRVEVVNNPGAAPRIILEYSRGGLPQKGTVEIAPSAAGYYAAHPIDPKGSLPKGSRKAVPTTEHPIRPAPPPKESSPSSPVSKPTPPAKPPSQAEEIPEPPEEIPEEPQEPEPARFPEPTREQQDDCPIDPWRGDCRELCVPNAPWEWCQYTE